MTIRPYLKARPWTWKTQDGPQFPGIGLFRGDRLQAHMTPTEARTVADTLHDLADQIDQETLIPGPKPARRRTIRRLNPSTPERVPAVPSKKLPVGWKRLTTEPVPGDQP
ncbi:hypothetical protein [Arthrobacter sp. E3]|uniref:hypothetical protein n=1 Tax=Arthrobacter sp. E3 TaxID=517402 RepID=UPI001A94AA10|nr:hypothetical protein [Arthrobacter sp. E3]